MFGFGNQDKAVDQETIDRLVNGCREVLGKLRAAPPPEAARIAEHLKERLKDNRIPFEFRRKAAELARRYERESNMRAVDSALHWASTFARAEKMAERSKSLAEARQFLARAMMLGADPSFRRASEREIEAIMLSGGVVRSGPTRAKPLDTAPKNPHRAKY